MTVGCGWSPVIKACEAQNAWDGSSPDVVADPAAASPHPSTIRWCGSPWPLWCSEQCASFSSSWTISSSCYQSFALRIFSLLPNSSSFGIFSNLTVKSIISIVWSSKSWAYYFYFSFKISMNITNNRVTSKSKRTMPSPRSAFLHLKWYSSKPISMVSWLHWAKAATFGSTREVLVLF